MELYTPTVCESSGIEDNECDGADPVHKQSSYQSDRIKSKNCELQERNDRRVKEMGNTRIDERYRLQRYITTMAASCLLKM